MCSNCLNQAEMVAGHLVLAAAVAKDPAHRFLADLGVVNPPDPVARDARTVAFLRNLDLDPVEILGADAVDAADTWVPDPVQERRVRIFASARPMGSQRRLATP